MINSFWVSSALQVVLAPSHCCCIVSRQCHLCSFCDPGGLWNYLNWFHDWTNTVFFSLGFGTVGRKLQVVKWLGIVSSYNLWVFWTHSGHPDCLYLLNEALTLLLHPPAFDFYHVEIIERVINWGGMLFLPVRLLNETKHCKRTSYVLSIDHGLTEYSVCVHYANTEYMTGYHHHYGK